MANELFSNQTPGPPGPAQMAPTPSGVMPGQPEFNEEAPSDQEQADYDQVVNKALDFMGKNAEATLAGINNKDKPIHENVGEMVVKIVKTIEGQAKAAGAQLGMDVLASAGEEVVEHLMELGDAGGIFPFKQSSDEYDQVQIMSLLHASKIVGEQLINSPQYTPALKDEAGNIFAQGLADENQRGEVDPSFYENISNSVAQGKRRAIEGR